LPTNINPDDTIFEHGCKARDIEVLTKVVAMLSGNSLAMIAKLAVKKAAFPIASTILIKNDKTIKG